MLIKRLIDAHQAADRLLFSNLELFLFCPGTAEDLVDTFFEVEVEMEKDVCRDLVCTSPKDEEGFLFNLTF